MCNSTNHGIIEQGRGRGVIAGEDLVETGVEGTSAHRLSALFDAEGHHIGDGLARLNISFPNCLWSSGRLSDSCLDIRAWSSLDGRFVHCVKYGISGLRLGAI